MYLDYEFKNEHNIKQYNDFLKTVNANPNNAVHAFFEAMTSIESKDLQMDFFLGANAAAKGQLFSHNGVINIMRPQYSGDKNVKAYQDVKLMFATYWLLCQKMNRGKAPAFAERTCNSQKNKMWADAYKIMMRRYIAGEHKLAQKTSLISAITQNPASQLTHNQKRIAKFACVATIIAGITLMGIGGAGIAGFALLATLTLTGSQTLFALGVTSTLVSAIGLLAINSSNNVDNKNNAKQPATHFVK